MGHIFKTRLLTGQQWSKPLIPALKNQRQVDHCEDQPSYLVLGEPEPHSETLSQNKKRKEREREGHDVSYRAGN